MVKRGGKSRVPKQPRVVSGKYVGTDKGFGFVVLDDSKAEDIFIPPSSTWGALHGDEVLCRLVDAKPAEAPVAKKTGRRFPKGHVGKLPGGKGRDLGASSGQVSNQPGGADTLQRQTGEIIEIVDRKPLIGTYFTSGLDGFIRPLENKFAHLFEVPPKSKNRFGLVDGHRVVFMVPRRKRGYREGLYRHSHVVHCHVVEVLGHVHDPGVDVLTLVRQHGVPYEWPEDVLAQAADVDEEVISDAITGRLDLRDQMIFTIDGEDTKDIDDAISVSRTDCGGWKLGVHIADVSHYVQPDTPIDREAFNRGTSVYLADRVIPMLPHRLSSGICSLFPDVDRLAVSCLMTVDAGGNVRSYEIVPSVIRSVRRWTYTQVQDMLDVMAISFEIGLRLSPKTRLLPRVLARPQPISNRNAYMEGGDFAIAADWQETFASLDVLRETLHQKRHAKGALDFDLPEAKIRVDEDGRPVSVEVYERSRATGIIEECMILCNETVAAHALKHEIPFVYRTHEPPSGEKLAKLRGIAQDFGLPFHAALGPKAIQGLLEAAIDSPAYQAIAMAALTSMPQAYYSPEGPTHYGLASQNYCHFTSPIRRYADLQVHRELKAWCRSDGLSAGSEGAIGEGAHCPHVQLTQSAQSAQDILNHHTALHAIAAQCSKTEREAEALEREVTQLKKVQFMQSQTGQIFEGKVSGITPWGVYVMLPNTIEGLIPAETLKRVGYSLNKDKNRYISKRSSMAIAMGDPLSVRLVSADEDERRLNFSLSHSGDSSR